MKKKLNISRESNVAFLHNFLALLTGTLSLVVIQVVSLPIFLHYLTIENYAIWLASYSLAQFSGLLDFGGIASYQNLFSVFHSKQESFKIKNSLKQITNLLAISYLIFIVAVFIISLILDENFNFFLFLIFLFSNLLQSFSGLLEGLMRIDSKTSIGLHLSNGLRGVEFLGTCLAVVFFSNSLITIGLLGVLLKLVFFVFLNFRLPSRYKVVYFGRFSTSEIRSIVQNSYPFLLVKVSELLSINGTAIILSSIVSPPTFVAFMSARTFFRFGLQITNLISHTSGYEMTSSWVKGNFKEMKFLIKLSFLLVSIASFLLALIYLLIGDLLFTLWTHNEIQLDKRIFFLGALYSVIISLNQNQKTLFNSINRNFIISIIHLVSSIFLVSFFLVFYFDYYVTFLFMTLVAFELMNFLANIVFTYGKLEKYFYSID